MSFDIDNFQFEHTEEIPVMREAAEKWEERTYTSVTSPGDVTLKILPEKTGNLEPINYAKEFTYEFDGNPAVPGFSASFSFKVVEGQDKSDANRNITYQYLSTQLFKGDDGIANSSLLSMLKSAGVPDNELGSLPGYLTAIQRAQLEGTLMKARNDWVGFCQECYSTKLMELTGATTLDIAKRDADRKQEKAARKFATKFPRASRFPRGENGYKPTVKCADCGAIIRARDNIVHWYKKETNGASDVPF